MKKERNTIFDNLRGLCMLGVIAIHVGSMAVSAHAASPLLVLVTNILSRYSVPAFFFISGYGLFYSIPLEESFSYKLFFKKRMKSIGLPYLGFSLFYLCYNALAAHDLSFLYPKNILFCLFFGTAEYHIYFLVILLWFYLLFPLWRRLLRSMETVGLKVTVPVLFLLQVWLYHFSLHFWTYPAWVGRHPFLLNLLNYRLNYLPLFYLFVFLLGGIIARHYTAFDRLITERKGLVTAFFCASVACNTYLFWRWTFLWEMPYEATINFLQQLSLPGLVYTIAAIFFFSMVLASNRYPCKTALRQMSERSFVIYLIHPVWIDQLAYLAIKYRHGLENVSMPLFYLLVLFISWGLAEVWHQFRIRQAG